MNIQRNELFGVEDTDILRKRVSKIANITAENDEVSTIIDKVSEYLRNEGATTREILLHGSVLSNILIKSSAENRNEPIF